MVAVPPSPHREREGPSPASQPTRIVRGGTPNHTTRGGPPFSPFSMAGWFRHFLSSGCSSFSIPDGDPTQRVMTFHLSPRRGVHRGPSLHAPGFTHGPPRGRGCIFYRAKEPIPVPPGRETEERRPPPRPPAFPSPWSSPGAPDSGDGLPPHATLHPFGGGGVTPPVPAGGGPRPPGKKGGGCSEGSR